MNWFMDMLGMVFGPVMRWIFLFVGNYGVAIIVFTILCRLLQVPFAVKQQRSMAGNARMQMKLRKIQQKYKDDKRRQQEETQKFYQREGYNPMRAGCSGGMLAQFPIMFGLIAAINRPLHWTLQIPRYVVERIEYVVRAEAAEAETGALMNMLTGGGVGRIELTIAENIDRFAHMFDYGNELYDYAQYLPRIQEFSEGFSLFGMQLGVTPNDASSWIYYLVPVFAALAALATAVFQFFRQRESNPMMQQQSQNPVMMGCMTFGMPLMSGIWAWFFPVGVGIFWVASSLIAFIQTVVLHYMMPPQKMLARVLADETVTRRSRENSKKKVAEL